MSKLDDHAELVAKRLIEQLRNGTAPWQRPWEPGKKHLPHNPTTGKEYRGGNAVWLMMQGRDDPRWMTYRQTAAEGAQVRKGQKGVRLQYVITREKEKVLDKSGKPILGADGKPLTQTVELDRPKVVGFSVFNAEQIEGLAPLERKEPGHEWERQQRAESILARSGAVIEHRPGDRAYYSPREDKIVLPEREQFDQSDKYYATALHELGHWTGHESRLDRGLTENRDKESYAKEELRAEISSMMVGDRIGVGHDPDQHAAYVQSWIKALEEDPREIFRAARDAERISEYVMAFEYSHEREQTRQPEAEATAEPVAAHSTVEHESEGMEM